MKVVYGVPYIEVDFGERPEGWKLFLEKERCIKETQEASRNGAYSDGEGYYGPARPLHFFEIPFDSLEKQYRQELTDKGVSFTHNYWSPKFVGNKFWVVPLTAQKIK